MNDPTETKRPSDQNVEVDPMVFLVEAMQKGYPRLDEALTWFGSCGGCRKTG
jgi:hypothetical protein